MRITFFFILLVCVSCIQEADISYINHSPVPVVNCILNPDSLIKVNLTLSKSLGAETKATFLPIENASMLLYEDNIPIGALAYQNNGNYLLNYYPKLGKHYLIEIIAEGYPTVTASDKVPDDKPFVHEYLYENKELYLLFKSQHYEEAASYWLNLYYDFIESDHPRGGNSFNPLDWNEGDPIPEGFSLKRLPVSEIVLESPPLYIDRFNAYYDQFEKAYTFFDLLRIEERYVNEDLFDMTLKLNMSRSLLFYGKKVEGTGIYLSATLASNHFDKYLKSSFINYLNTDHWGKEPDPFSTPVRIYSNIQNGLGIFAAVTSVTIKIDE